MCIALKSGLMPLSPSNSKTSHRCSSAPTNFRMEAGQSARLWPARKSSRFYCGREPEKMMKTRPPEQSDAERSTFHHSTLESPRLAKLLAFLRARCASGATTLEITQSCVTTRASSDVSELVANGVRILTRFDGTTESGRRVFRYVLAECLPAPPKTPPPPATAQIHAVEQELALL